MSTETDSWPLTQNGKIIHQWCRYVWSNLWLGCNIISFLK
jgi:hypothetical protein